MKALATLTLAAACAFAAEPVSTLKVQISELPPRPGKVAYSLFRSPEGFPEASEVAVARGFLEWSGTGPLSFEIPRLRRGGYALSVFLDTNANQRLDKSFLGIPTESIGFSANPVVRFRAPRFDEARIDLAEAVHEIQVRMIQ